jgi:hypothetical protein
MNEALALEFRQGRLATQHMSVLADGEVHPLARGLILPLHLASDSDR